MNSEFNMQIQMDRNSHKKNTEIVDDIAEMEGQPLMYRGTLLQWTPGNIIVDTNKDKYWPNAAMDNINYDYDSYETNYDDANETNNDRN